ncbi:hypothetical protein [Edaphocola flava]|uniref:hypothetical protein n=1 Tax=Edaphocola flava TaxID=2499629 RepID=UPI00100B8BDA|nr:hypothetical protein [Edaphocola flava]
MATIYVIAGPPGIGKSTSGAEYIPEDIKILDPDLVVQRYKEQGFQQYKDIGNIRFDTLLRQELNTCEDFAIELNLGYQSHYDLLKKIKNYSLDNKIDVILFYTDSLDLCLERVRIRHENGLHLVPAETIEEMYNNTLPLLKEHFKLISNLTLLDVKKDVIQPEIVLLSNENKIDHGSNYKFPNWISKLHIKLPNKTLKVNTASIKKVPRQKP